MELTGPAPFVVLRSCLESWVMTHGDRLRSRGIDLEINVSDRSEKRLVALALDGEERIGQLLVWDTGEAELGAIEVAGEKEVLVETREITTRFGLRESLNAVVSAVLDEEVVLPLPS